MGEVYRATDSVLERPVAVKLLSEHYARDSESRARFEREALAAARLSRERHVVTVFDVGEHYGRPLIVMEYVDGGSVHDRLGHGRVPCEQALDWLEQVARALDRAHAQGIVHRDVKPANLLLDSEGNVRVSDFGIASAAGLETVTLPGTVLGTAGYISPEQAQGEPATPASDRYSLAVIAFELLTGRRPFEGETAATQALAHVTAPVPSAERLDSRLPRGVDDVLARGLAKDPAERPASCAELVGQLREALRPAEPGHTRAPAASTTLVAPTTASSDGEAPATRVLPVPDPPRPAPRAPRERRGRWTRRSVGARSVVLVSVVAIAVGTLAGLFVFGFDERREGEATTGRAPAAAASEEETQPAPTVDGAALNAEGFELMRGGRFEEALPVLRRAVGALLGQKTFDEAYASYNLAFTRFALGSCDGVIGLLDRSERIQGHRGEIDRLREEWNGRCAPATAEDDDDDDGPGNSGSARGKGNGKGRGRA